MLNILSRFRHLRNAIPSGIDAKVRTIYESARKISEFLRFMNLQEKTQNFFQNYAFFGRKSRFRGTKHT